MTHLEQIRLGEAIVAEVAAAYRCPVRALTASPRHIPATIAAITWMRHLGMSWPNVASALAYEVREAPIHLIRRAARVSPYLADPANLFVAIDQPPAGTAS